jgi:hypothetical protein
LDAACGLSSWTGPKLDFDEIGAALDLGPDRRVDGDDAFALESSDDLGGAPLGGEGQLG